jgi:hypothetical protein
VIVVAGGPDRADRAEGVEAASPGQTLDRAAPAVHWTLVVFGVAFGRHGA